MYLLLTIFLLLEFVHEGFKLRKWHILSGIIEGIWLLGILLVAYGIYTLPYNNLRVGTICICPSELRMLLAYIFVRIGTGDIILNLCAGLPVTFRGTTKLLDRLITWLVVKLRIAEGLLLFIRMVFAVMGILILIFG
jgi:hypothetical protein